MTWKIIQPQIKQVEWKKNKQNTWSLLETGLTIKRVLQKAEMEINQAEIIIQMDFGRRVNEKLMISKQISCEHAQIRRGND